MIRSYKNLVGFAASILFTAATVICALAHAASDVIIAIGLFAVGSAAHSAFMVYSDSSRLRRILSSSRDNCSSAWQLATDLVNDSAALRTKLDQAVADAQSLNIQLKLSQRQRRNTEEIIYSIHEAVIVTDASERLVLANDAAGELFGFDARKSALKPISDIITAQDFIETIKKSRESKTRHSRHEVVVGDSDAHRIFECLVSCIYDETSQPSGVVAVLHDVTKEKEISQMKNEFVSHVSHELKTPLASITAYAEMLVDGEASDDETRAEFYSIIQTQAQRLNRLIEDILNISRIESGLAKVNREPASMTILIRDAVQMIKSYAAEKNIQVFEQTPIVFDQVYVDKDMISQVIINLLSNAVKYTPAGGQVSVTSEVNESDGLVRMTVTDTGVGIPADEVNKVFDKFYRVQANNKCAKGTGLGLNLVKQIVEKVHDGRVFVTSRQGQGSTFGFELPLGAPQTVEVG